MARRLSPVASFESLLGSIIKPSLRDGSDSEHDFGANFRHGGRKRHNTITPTNIGVSLEDDFLDNIRSCSSEPTNLDELALFDLL